MHEDIDNAVIALVRALQKHMEGTVQFAEVQLGGGQEHSFRVGLAEEQYPLGGVVTVPEDTKRNRNR